MEHNINTSNR
ncbi:hypothetical protein QTG54_013827 [Skeletonema marinoi]|uniref:Uncharacterized protein n=1 Tax=Skeletonema marinoi TaxID=267567 RepID=A0AAD8XXX9_9STRA|nr:hypothetical protein QTG54_013827 [Skeletonema marinoi]